MTRHAAIFPRFLTRAAVLMLLIGGPAVAQSADPAALFYGQKDSGVRARIVGAGPELSAQRFPCANCHGRDGQGGIEGSRRMPALVAMGGQPGPDAGALYLAMAQGLASDGRALDPLMPRYLIEPQDASALAGFLQELPMRERRGIGAGQVVFLLPDGGTAEPLALAFAQGFAAAIAGRRPWGREIALTRDATRPSFAALALPTETPDDPDLPLLAPLGPFDESRAGPVRLLCAKPSAQLTALIDSLPADTGLQVIGDGPLARQAATQTKTRGSGDAMAVLLLTRIPADPPPNAAILALADQLGEAAAQDLAARGHSVTLSDGCADLPGMQGRNGTDRAILLGELTGKAVWNALSGAGRNLSRSRFLAALDENAEHEPGAPARIGVKPVLRQIIGNEAIQ